MSDEKYVLPFGFRFGQKYTDVVTGFKGIAILANLHSSGCISVGLTGKSKKGAKPTVYTVDIRSLIDDIDISSDPKKMHPFLNKIVRNKYSKIEGRVTNVAIFMHRNTHLVVQPLGSDKDGKPFEDFEADVAEFELVTKNGEGSIFSQITLPECLEYDESSELDSSHHPSPPTDRASSPFTTKI